MKQVFRDLAIPIILARARKTGADRLKDSLGQQRSVLVIPPAAAGSVGDAAMLNVAYDQLRRENFARVSIACAPGWEEIRPFDSFHNFDEWFFGQRRSTLAAAIKLLGEFSHSMLVGADCIDGTYNPGSITRRIALLDEHAKIGGDARILGASFSDQPNEYAVEVLRALDPRVAINARDPVSRTRMQNVVRNEIWQTADMAFLTEPDSTDSSVSAAFAFTELQRSEQRRVVGVMVNHVVDQKFDKFTDAHVPLLNRLIDEGISILLVPHDSRGERSDRVLLSELMQRMDTTQRQRIHLLDNAPPGAVQAALTSLDAVITSRMHAAILAMSVGTPAISFVYQGKFEGLYKLLGLEEEGLLLQPNDLVDRSAETIDTIIYHIQRRDYLADRILAVLPKVKRLAESNFKHSLSEA